MYITAARHLSCIESIVPSQAAWDDDCHKQESSKDTSTSNNPSTNKEENVHVVDTPSIPIFTGEPEVLQRWKDNPADRTVPKPPHAHMLHFTSVQALLEMAKKDVRHSNDHLPKPQSIIRNCQVLL